MAWTELDENIKYLNAEDVNNVYENCLYIAEVLKNLKASIDSSDVINPEASMNSEIGKIQGILQNVEDDIAVINSGEYDDFEIFSLYYDENKTIGKYFRKSDYVRWVQVLNDLYEMIVEEKGVWGGLVLLSESGEPDAQDFYGNDIFIRRNLFV